MSSQPNSTHSDSKFSSAALGSWVLLWTILFLPSLLDGEISALRSALALAAFALATLRFPSRGPAYWCLALLTIPWESFLQGSCDPILGQITANAAAPLVTLTGLSVQVVQLHVPTLMAQDLQLHVTPLCAGLGPLFTFSTLGLSVGLFMLNKSPREIWLAIITPIAGLLANILRVAISTHAANLWLDRHPWAWEVAHDVIGYFCFAGVYALLWWTLLNFKHSAANTITPNA